MSIVTLFITSVKQNDFLRMMDLVRKGKDNKTKNLPEGR